MVTLRCTKKLLKRLGKPATNHLVPNTNRLGDWYANPISLPFPGRGLNLFVNESTRLAVFVPGRGSRRGVPNFQDRVAALLGRIGIPEDLVASELQAMRKVQVSKTASRSVLGSMNEISLQAWWQARARESYEALSLVELELEVAEMPQSPIGWSNAARVARSIFATS